MKYMNLDLFQQDGYLQEVNRLFFHPLGMALEFTRTANGEVYLSGIRDSRDDPEGIIFDPPPDQEVIERLTAEFAVRRQARLKGLGFEIQTTEQVT